MAPISALNLCGAFSAAGGAWLDAFRAQGDPGILQRRLHALIVQAAIEQSVDNMDV